jgi:hypothetical protein
MPIETNALARRAEPEAPSEGDFQAFCTALSSSARGRWFLDEYTKRNRNADTQVVLAALERLEARIAAEGLMVERLRDDLRTLLIAIRRVRPDSDATGTPEEPPKLAGLLGLLEHRIDTMVEAPPGPPAAETIGAHAMPDDPEQEVTRVHLTVVPPPEEPELPIPSPVTVQPPSISLVGTAAIMPSPFDSTPSEPAAIDRIPATVHKKVPALPSATVAIAGAAEEEFWMHSVAELMPRAFRETPPIAETAPPAVQLSVETEFRTEVQAEVSFEIQVEAATVINEAQSPAKAAPAPPPDPLAVLMALSDYERLALFT